MFRTIADGVCIMSTWSLAAAIRLRDAQPATVKAYVVSTTDGNIFPRRHRRTR